MIESDLADFLLASPPLAALVGTRVYPETLPPAALATGYPAVTFFKVSSPRDHTHDGVEGLRFARFQFNCWGKTYKDAKRVAKALTSALDNFRGMMGDSTVGAVFVEDEADIADPALAVGTDVPRGVRVDARVIHGA